MRLNHTSIRGVGILPTRDLACEVVGIQKEKIAIGVLGALPLKGILPTRELACGVLELGS
jgi:hypothetical protein